MNSRKGNRKHCDKKLSESLVSQGISISEHHANIYLAMLRGFCMPKGLPNRCDHAKTLVTGGEGRMLYFFHINPLQWSRAGQKGVNGRTYETEVGLGWKREGS